MSITDTFNENEVLYLCYEHNEKALNIIVRKYEQVFKYFLYKNRVGWKDYDLLLDEGRELIFYCLKVYDKDYPFFAFFKLCSVRLIMRYFRKKKIEEVNLDGFEIKHQLEEPLVTEYKEADIILANPIQEAIAKGIKDGNKLNQIAKELNLDAKKIYYEFEKMKKMNRNRQ